jgi:hypothetical protein
MDAAADPFCRATAVCAASTATTLTFLVAMSARLENADPPFLRVMSFAA